jgi:membrane-bound ClpP family serine protease
VGMASLGPGCQAKRGIVPNILIIVVGAILIPLAFVSTAVRTTYVLPYYIIIGVVMFILLAFLITSGVIMLQKMSALKKSMAALDSWANQRDRYRMNKSIGQSLLFHSIFQLVIVIVGKYCAVSVCFVLSFAYRSSSADFISKQFNHQ